MGDREGLETGVDFEDSLVESGCPGKKTSEQSVSKSKLLPIVFRLSAFGMHRTHAGGTSGLH